MSESTNGWREEPKVLQNRIEKRTRRSFLVGQSQFKLDNVITELSSEEVEIHHSIAALVSSSTTGQQHMLAKVIADVAAVLIKQLCNMDTAYMPEENLLWSPIHLNHE
jgi:hypothetical protein